MRAWKQTLKLSLVGFIGLIMLPVSVFAVESASTNYKVNEVFFGSGGQLEACSGSFCSKQSLGELTAGRTASPNFVAQGGFNTDRLPYLEFTVGTTNVDLGELTSTTTKTTTATFNVKAYLAQGYVVTNASDPPKNGSYFMKNLTIPSAPAVGTEQFGINLVANTSPVAFGANPTQEPDSTFGFGQATADYSSPNLYKYAKGDVVAQSSLSTSYTNYTVSYLFNISNVTPGGSYLMQHNLVATATF
jgi:hypothetical protein